MVATNEDRSELTSNRLARMSSGRARAAICCHSMSGPRLVGSFVLSGSHLLLVLALAGCASGAGAEVDGGGGDGDGGGGGGDDGRQVDGGGGCEGDLPCAAIYVDGAA